MSNNQQGPGQSGKRRYTDNSFHTPEGNRSETGTHTYIVYMFAFFMRSSYLVKDNCMMHLDTGICRICLKEICKY